MPIPLRRRGCAAVVPLPLPVTDLCELHRSARRFFTANLSMSSNASSDDLELGDDLSISSPARGQTLGGAPAASTKPASSSSQEALPRTGPTREARAAAALARLAPVDSKGEIDPDGELLKQRCLLEKERDWQRFIERSLVGPNTYLQVRWPSLSLLHNAKVRRLIFQAFSFRLKSSSACVA